MARAIAEFLGTLILVLFGCGAAVLGGDHVGQLGIALAFGFAIVALAYGLGPISGGHVNPAVSLGMFIAGRMTLPDMLVYWVAQCLGALAGAGILAVIAGSTEHLGQNGWGPGYLGGFSLTAAATFEVVMTALFVAVILGATRPEAAPGTAGLAIGLTLAAIHIVGIQVTGVSVNPARSLGPAVLAGGQAISQLWLFIVAPLVGGILGALPFRMNLLAIAPPAPAGERVDTSRP
ncbi:aquaporin [Phenylobacterium sp.]|uniref:aquaporin n=1 Tax=Phenylobacterium sp. TaxID=1871053 RepID=UPI00121A5E2A|nr:aquaporin [Phenylobacterium sp.]THD59043.1 MAG: aquaporin [Phenylobacterium sp.]